MRPKRIGGLLRAGFLAALVAFQPVAGVPVLRVAALGAATVVVDAATPAEAEARSSSGRSSGGYSRPSSSRTPSVGGGSGSRSSPSWFGSSPSPASPTRTPSIGGSFFGGAGSSTGKDSSGGYTRPSPPSPSSSTTSPSGRAAPPPPSAGDSAISRQGAADSLDRYRTPPASPSALAPRPASASPSTAPPSSSTTTSSPSGGWFGGSSSPSGGGGFRYPAAPRTPSTQTRPYPDAYRGYGWAPPAYALNGTRRFGIWDGLFLWFLLDTLAKPGHAAFFHDNADDPGYRAWRAEADRLAQTDPQVRDQLAALDARVGEQAGTPRQPGRLPPDVPADVAKADSAAALPSSDAGARKSGGWGWVAVVILVVLGGLAVVVLLRTRNRAKTKTAPGPSPVSNQQESAPMFGSLGNYVGAKLSGQPYRPSLFRVGMTITIDPTPFILAEGVTKVQPPPDSGGNRLISVEAVSTLTVGNATLYRLTLPGGAFFQIHLDANSVPDECRYFVPIDRVTPADTDEWGFWLDGTEGMVGWPEFQTKDGKLYARTWMPGSQRVNPVALSESRQTLRGTIQAQHSAMLYGAPTGAADPAPPYEYILVSVIEEGGQAWVEIAAGIDVNPAQLSLA